MPAPKLYIGSAEIATILGVSRREAQYIIKSFALKGNTISVGRVSKVSLKYFARYLSEMDGSDIYETFEALKSALKSA